MGLRGIARPPSKATKMRGYAVESQVKRRALYTARPPLAGIRASHRPWRGRTRGVFATKKNPIEPLGNYSLRQRKPGVYRRLCCPGRQIFLTNCHVFLPIKPCAALFENGQTACLARALAGELARHPALEGLDHQPVDLRGRGTWERGFEQCRPEPGPITFMAHSRHDLALRADTGRGADKTLRDHIGNDAVIGTAEM